MKIGFIEDQYRNLREIHIIRDYFPPTEEGQRAYKQQVKKDKGVLNVRYIPQEDRTALEETLTQIITILTHGDATDQCKSGKPYKRIWKQIPVQYIGVDEGGFGLSHFKTTYAYYRVRDQKEKLTAKKGSISRQAYIWMEKLGLRSEHQYKNKDHLPQTQYRYQVNIAFDVLDLYRYVISKGATLSKEIHAQLAEKLRERGSQYDGPIEKLKAEMADLKEKRDRLFQQAKRIDSMKYK